MRIRINQFECRFSQRRYEIVKWYPNEYYNAEQKLIEEGYVKVEFENGNWSMKKDYHSITSSCFKNPESCFTVATLHYDDGEGCCDMRTIGTRLLDLDKQERDDFFDVYAMAEERIHREACLKEMMENDEALGLYDDSAR